MSDDPKDVIEFAIRSTFDSYPKEDDPDWKPGWIKPKECAHLALAVIAGLFRPPALRVRRQDIGRQRATEVRMITVATSRGELKWPAKCHR
jgi:hypothetical protein